MTKNVSAFAEPPREIISTTHFSAVDSKRNVIAVTTTIEENMGCGIVVPGEKAGLRSS